MEVHVRRDVSDFATVDGNFISQHARSWDFDRVSPVVVVVAEGIREVENRVFRNLGGVGGYVEVRWLDCSLGHRVRDQEEIEGSVDYLGLLNETVVDVGSLWRVGNGGVHAHLEESLSNTLVDDDEGVLWQRWLLLAVDGVLLLNNLVELLKLVADDLGSHRVANSVPVDEDVIGELALVVVSESLESAFEVLLEHAGADDFLALLALGTCLGVVLAHVLVIGSAEADDALFTLVANVDSDKHGLRGDFGTEVEAPEVSAELGVDLSEDVDVDPVVVLLDGLARNKLGDDWTVGVDLVLESGVEVLLLDGVRHDDQEEVEVLGLSWLAELSSLGVFAANICAVVVIDSVLERLDSRLVAELDDVAVIDVNIKPSLL